MSLFFFHFFDGETLSHDELGLELPSADAAYVEAAAAARGMWPELLATRCDPLRCAFDITSEGGEELFRLRFSELVDNCRTPGRKPAFATLTRNLEETHRRATSAKADFRSSVLDMRQSLAESNALLARFTAFERTMQPKRS